jgi:hypothetical protein
MTTAAEQREREVKEKARAYLAARANSTVGRPMPPQDGPQLVAEDVPHDMVQWEEAVEQVRRAKESLLLPESAFMRYPLPGLAELVGGVRPNRVHYYVSASNNGKTMFARNFIVNAIAAGQSCSIMTTETTPEDFRLSLAAAALGLHPGDISTGEYLKRPDAKDVATRLAEEMDRWADYESGAHSLLRISSAAGYLTPESVRADARAVANGGFVWSLIDHGDHVEGTPKMPEPVMSNAVNTAIWRSTIDLDLRTMVFSQLNNDVFRKNKLGMCIPPSEEMVKYGSKKKELGWVMLSGHRPLRQFEDEKERKDEINLFKSGQRTIRDITLPALHVRVMKHRDYGERVGASVLLEVHNGRLGAPTKDTLGDVHGISTTRRSLV